MPTVSPQETLTDIVLNNPEYAAVLERWGLDYCCGGNITLKDAASQSGISLDEILQSMSLAQRDPDEQDYTQMPLNELADHIENTHHAYLHEELPRLCALAEKVENAHGANHPELLKLLETVRELSADFAPHLMKEEKVIFPLIRQIATATQLPELPFGTFANPVRVLCAEHELTGEFLKQIREITNEYSLPDDACTSYQTLYSNLQFLESDTHKHVHKENNILFPRTLEKEEELQKVHS